MNKMRVGVMVVFSLLASCTANQPPKETTADGLVRVPSRAEGGVYRDLDADFTRYKRLMIEPLTVEFLAGWRKQHPDVHDSESIIGLDQIPSTMAIIGGGPVGCEYASVFTAPWTDHSARA